MNREHDEFLCRIAKTLYYGNTSSFDTVSLPLTELAAEFYNEVKKEKSLERLQVEEVAEMNQNACVSTCSLVLAILYLEKMKTINPIYVEKVAPSELFLVSLLVASKFLNDDGDDDAVLNSEWAACAGLPLKQVNEIEKSFLEAIKWEIYITKTKFWTRLLDAERYLANQEGRRRGWYSYTELNILLNICHLKILKEMLTFSVLCVTGYTASVVTMLGIGLLAIQIKHLLTSCILCILVNREFSTNLNYYYPNVSLSVTDFKSESAINKSEITNNVFSDQIISSYELNHDKFENVCDTSSLICYFTNLTAEIFAIRIRFPPIYDRISQEIHTNEKSKIVGKTSLLYTKPVWANL